MFEVNLTDFTITRFLWVKPHYMAMQSIILHFWSKYHTNAAKYYCETFWNMMFLHLFWYRLYYYSVWSINHCAFPRRSFCWLSYIKTYMSSKLLVSSSRVICGVWSDPRTSLSTEVVYLNFSILFLHLFTSAGFHLKVWLDYIITKRSHLCCRCVKPPTHPLKVETELIQKLHFWSRILFIVIIFLVWLTYLCNLSQTRSAKWSTCPFIRRV